MRNGGLRRREDPSGRQNSRPTSLARFISDTKKTVAARDGARAKSFSSSITVIATWLSMRVFPMCTSKRTLVHLLVYNAEIHSARLRGTAFGAAAATNWLFNFVVSRATPVMLDTMGEGGYGTFLFCE